MQKLTKFKVIFDLFTVCVYFIQQHNCKLYYIYLMIISKIQSEIGHCSCDSAKFKAPADFSHHAILFFDIVLNVKSSFFNITSKILEKYELPSLSQLLCSSYSKPQWKHTYVKAVNKLWSNQLVGEIKTKKSLKCLPVDNLRIGSTHLVWRSLYSTVSDVRKGITKARILTGTYLLQKKTNRNSFNV